jgi:hypothetical protein
MNEEAFDQVDEEDLTYEVSDEALKCIEDLWLASIPV